MVGYPAFAPLGEEAGGRLGRLGEAAAAYRDAFRERAEQAARHHRVQQHEHPLVVGAPNQAPERSEEHTSELQSLMRISYAVFCLKKTKKQTITQQDNMQDPEL